MTPSDSVIFCLSYGITFQNGFLSPLKWTFFQREMHCCHGCRHVPVESVNARMVITLLFYDMSYLSTE